MSYVAGLGAAKKPDSFLVQINKQGANSLKPLASTIDSIPVLSRSQKSALKATPLDFLINLMDPITDRIGVAVDRVLAKEGFKQSYLGFGKFDLRRKRDADRKLDPSVRNVIVKLRTAFALIVLTGSKPLEIATELGKQGLNLIGLGGLGGFGDKNNLGAGGVDDAAALSALVALGPGLLGVIGSIITACTKGTPEVVEAAGSATTGPGVPVVLPQLPPAQTVSDLPKIAIIAATAVTVLGGLFFVSQSNRRRR